MQPKCETCLLSVGFFTRARALTDVRLWVRWSQDVRDIWVTLMLETEDWDLVELCHARGLQWHPWAATTMINVGFDDKLDKLKWMHSKGCPMDGASASLPIAYRFSARAPMWRQT